MEVICCNKESKILINILVCPWKGVLSELNNHLKFCFFDSKNLKPKIKKILEEDVRKPVINEKKDIYQDEEEDPSSAYAGFNIKASLKARLYSKKHILMDKVLNAEEKDRSDILDYLGYSDSPNNLTNISNVVCTKISSNNNLNLSNNSTTVCSNVVAEKNDDTISNHSEKDNEMLNKKRERQNDMININKMNNFDNIENVDPFTLDEEAQLDLAIKRSLEKD